METSKDKKKKETLGKKLDDFLSNNQTEECVGEECLINDGKEIVERVEKVYKTNINSIFNEDTTTYILSLLKLDDAVNMAPVSFELDEQEYSVQVERFERNSAIKGGILVLSPTKLKA